jgi:hypothetical protein
MDTDLDLRIAMEARLKVVEFELDNPVWMLGYQTRYQYMLERQRLLLRLAKLED